MRRGLVLSGGAALGAYQAGVLIAMAEAGMEFEIISATSIGTINAAAWNIDEVMENLSDHWIENVEELKPFDPGRLLKAGNPFQFHTALEKLADRYRALYPFENQRTEVIVTVTDYDRHQLHVASTSDITISREDRELFLKASTAILHIGSRPIEIQGRRFFDGGYHSNVPIAPLLDKCLDEIWVLPLSPVRRRAKLNSRIPKNMSRAKKALPFAYAHSLVGLAEQILHPPAMNHDQAETYIISPYASARVNKFGLSKALLFSSENVKRLLRAGFADGADAMDRYLSGNRR